MASDLAPELALIPAGEFLMGSEDAEEDERPVHRVHVDDFFIGVQPVTNAEYARFARETGHRSPAIYELPLVVKAGGAERERAFRQVGTPYVWERRPPAAGSGRPPRHARPLRRRVRVLRVAVGLDRASRSVCRPKPSGRRPRAAAWSPNGIRGAIGSIATWRTSWSTRR